MKGLVGIGGSKSRGTRARSARRVAVTIAGLSVALLTERGLQGAETVVHQRSGGSSAYVQSFPADGCTSGFVIANPSSYQVVSKTTGGKTAVTDASVLNAYAEGYDWCTGRYWVVELDAVPLTASQFHLDAALNSATLQGELSASWGYLYVGSQNLGTLS